MPGFVREWPLPTLSGVPGNVLRESAVPGEIEFGAGSAFNGGTINNPIDFVDMSAAPVGNAGQARLRYNGADLQVSYSGAPYVNIVTGTVTPPSLQSAYAGAGGNTIAATAARPIAFLNAVDATDLLTLTRTFAGGGSALAVSMGATTTGNGAMVTVASGATGYGIIVDNAGSLPASYFVSSSALATSHSVQAEQIGTGLALCLAATNIGTNSGGVATFHKRPTAGAANGGIGVDILMGGAGGTTTGSGIFVTMTSGQATGSAISVAGGIQAASAPVFTAAQTWNAGGVTFVGDNLSITDTASAATSRLTQVRGGTAGTSDRSVLYRNGVPFFSDNGSLPYIITNANANFILSSDTLNVSRISYAAANTGGPVMQLMFSRGTNAAPTTVVTGDLVGQFEGAGYIGATSGHSVMARIKIHADGVPADNSSAPGRLTFATVPSASTTTVDRWSVVAAGHLQGASALVIGWTASTTDPSGALDVGIKRSAASILLLTNGSTGFGSLLGSSFKMAAAGGFGTSTSLTDPTASLDCALIGTKSDFVTLTPGNLNFYDVATASTAVQFGAVGFKTQSDLVFGWTASTTNATDAFDAGFSRLGPASAALGSGISGNGTGTLTLTTVTSPAATSLSIQGAGVLAATAKLTTGHFVVGVDPTQDFATLSTFSSTETPLFAYATAATTEAFQCQADSPYTASGLQSVFRIIAGPFTGATGTGAGFSLNGHNGSASTAGAALQAYKENSTVGNALYSLVLFANDGSSNSVVDPMVAISSGGFIKGRSGCVIGWTASTSDPLAALATGLSRTADTKVALGNGTASDKTGTLQLASIELSPGIDTTAGDAATINATAGRFRKDTSGATFMLTNSFITANSIILLTAANAAVDTTAVSWTVLAGAGSATITFVAAPTSDFDMDFLVIN